MKVCFETFGCRLNRAEALEDEANWLAQGWTRVESHAEADTIVVRGCSVTSRAQRDCEKLIAHLRRKYPGKRVVVCGCLKGATAATGPRSGTDRPADLPPPLPTRTARAFLKVQDGCSGRCSFCIVPRFRGASVSVPFAEVMEKARRFIAAGYHEIVVTGCNLVLYASEGKRLPDLVAALAELSEACRIRLGSVEPGACAREVVEVMAEHANVCRYLHLAVQSGSEVMLKAMRRPYGVRDIEAVVKLAHERLPGLGLGCDVIAGFPGERSLDHIATRGLLERLSFNKAHVFPFSARPGTVAFGLPEQVPHDMRRHRAHELERLVLRQRIRFAQSFLKRPVEVLIEDEAHQAGWTAEYVWCEGGDSSGVVPRKGLARVTPLTFNPLTHTLIGR